jgi:N-methylhydantoinase B
MADGPAADLRLLGRVRETLEQAVAQMDRLLARGSTAEEVARLGWRASGFYGWRDGRLLLGGRDSHPLLLDGIATALPALAARLGEPDLAPVPGAVYLANDPAAGGTSLGDLLCVQPIAAGGLPRAWAGVAFHLPELCRDPWIGSDQPRHEGLVLPWLRATAADGTLAPMVRTILGANAGDPDRVEEELALARRALALGAGAFARLATREGPEAVLASLEAMAGACRTALARQVTHLAPGRARGRVGDLEAVVEPDGPRLAITLRPVNGQVRLPAGLARAACRTAIRQAFGAEVPSLAVVGGWDADWTVRVDEPGARPPASPGTLARFGTAQAIVDAVVSALAQWTPHLGKAPGPTGAFHLEIAGADASGAPFRCRLAVGSGLGASVWADGLSHASGLVDPSRTPVLEALEARLPLSVGAFALREGSGGPGQYRGGLGARLDLELREGAARVRALIPERASGLAGGRRGLDGRVTRISPRRDEACWDRPGLVLLDWEAGERLVAESPGGGGWGMGFRRSLMRLDADCAQGMVGADEARSQYGLILDPATGTRDEHLTYRVRSYLLGVLAVDDIAAGEELLD